MANVIELKVNQMAEKISSYIIKMTMEERFKKMKRERQIADIKFL